MGKYLKGQDVSVSLNGEKIAGSKNCTVSYTMNTEDVASKDDSEFYFENNEPTTLGWNVSNESFLVNVSDLVVLLQVFVSREKVLTTAKDSNERVNLNGYAFITELSVGAQMGDYVSVNLTLEGTGTDLID